jgi:hypothetical protein
MGGSSHLRDNLAARRATRTGSLASAEAAVRTAFASSVGDGSGAVVLVRDG